MLEIGCGLWAERGKLLGAEESWGRSLGADCTRPARNAKGDLATTRFAGCGQGASIGKRESFRTTDFKDEEGIHQDEPAAQFGLAVLEAMISGSTTIGLSNSPTVNKHMDNENTGLLVPSPTDRAVASAAAMERLVVDAIPRKRFGTAASSSAEQRSTEVSVVKWRAVIDAIS